MDTALAQVAGLIAVLVAASAHLTKSLVDIARMVRPSAPAWGPPVWAVGIGILVVTLYVAAAGQLPLTGHPAMWAQMTAVMLLAGVHVAIMAVGNTELGRRADSRREEHQEQAPGAVTTAQEPEVEVTQ